MTLNSMREGGEEISLYCAAYLSDLGRYCNTTWYPTWDQMIQYFGLDFEISTDRARFLAMFECPNCGATAYTLTLTPADTYGTMMRGMASHNHIDSRTAEEKDESRRIAALIVQRTAEQVEQVRAQRRANKAAEKARRDRESGKDPIGPPSPWAHRKKGRWL